MIKTVSRGGGVGPVGAMDAWGEPTKRIATERAVNRVAVSSTGLIAINAKLSVQVLTPDLAALQAVEVSDTITSISFSADGSVLFAGVGSTLLAWTSAANAKPRTVFALAATRVAYDEEGDGLAASTVAPYTVATLATIVERYRALGWDLPKPIETMWAWCLDGHWPAGFNKRPGRSPVKLLVL